MLKFLGATFIVILMIGPAVAVDYVQCEAIWDAMSRAKADLRAEEKSARYQMQWQHITKVCGKSPSAHALNIDYSSQEFRNIMTDWSNCRNREWSAAYNVDRNTKVSSAKERVKKIQADYQRAGCPNALPSQ